MRALLVVALALAACGRREPPKPESEPAEVKLVRLEPITDWNFDTEQPPPRSGSAVYPRLFLPRISIGDGDWSIVETPDAPSPPNVLAQEASNAEPVFNVVLLDGTAFTDFDMSVKLKAVAGEIDQGGGVIWRAKDARNYYIARYNPLEDNFRVYKIVDGTRTQLGNARAESAPGWHTLRVRMKGDAIECELDGKARLEAKDATFTAAGKIGLWTKADARTQFDDLSVR